LGLVIIILSIYVDLFPHSPLLRYKHTYIKDEKKATFTLVRGTFIQWKLELTSVLLGVRWHHSGSNSTQDLAEVLVSTPHGLILSPPLPDADWPLLQGLRDLPLFPSV